MLQPLDDHAKQRLTDRNDIITAVDILRTEGFDVGEMLAEMTKVFYVDLDEFNDVIAATQVYGTIS
jgi:hypothetical protein